MLVFKEILVWTCWSEIMFTHSQKQHGRPGRENSIRKSVLTWFIRFFFFSCCTDLPREAIGPARGPIASRGGSVPVLLRKPIPICNFPGGGGGLDPMSTLWIRPWANVTAYMYLQETNNEIKRKTFTCHSGCLIYTLRIHGNITKASSVT